MQLPQLTGFRSFVATVARASPTVNELTDARPGHLALPDVGRVRANRQAARAGETKRALAKNWRLFEEWAFRAGIKSLPADPAAVEAFLLYLSDDHQRLDRRGRPLGQGLKTASVQQALWAINARHRMAGLPPPGNSEAVRIAMAGIKRRKGMRRKQQAPLTIEHLRSIAFAPGLKGLRDKALLLVGFAGCFRRSELVGLRAEDLEETPYGLRVLLRRSKTDQFAQGAWVAIVAAQTHREACPVQALKAWLAATEITAGAIFRSLSKGAKPRLGAQLSAVSVDAVVKWAARECGFNPAAYGGHSLRAGYATYLAQLNKPPTLIARQGRWKKLDMVLAYARDDVAKALSGSY